MAGKQVAPRPPLLPTPTQSSLYVGDLHPLVSEKDLAFTFCRMGPIHSIRLCRDKLTNQSLRYAYVNFLHPFYACKAKACLNHSELWGKQMRIMWSQRDPIMRKSGRGNLFVKNLAPSVTSFILETIFSKFGTILSCKVADDNGISKGFGFVHFASVDSALAAMDAFNGAILEGKTLYVGKFKKKSQKQRAHKETKLNVNGGMNWDHFTQDDLILTKILEKLLQLVQKTLNCQNCSVLLS